MFGSISAKQLKLPIAFALILILLGAGGIAAGEFYLERARQQQLAAKTQRDAARDRLAKVSEEEREIRENLVHYERMVALGMVGPENRLDWIERIAQIKSNRKLSDIRYNIEPQRPLDYPGIAPAGEMDFVVSRMKLEMVLLHEGDLLDFLSDLVAAGQAHVVLRHCQMVRIDRPPSAAAVPTLRADCNVDFVTLKNNKPT